MTTPSTRRRTASVPGAKTKGSVELEYHTSINSPSSLDKKPVMPAGLRHSCDDTPGIRRRRRGNGFSYFNDSGQTISSRAERERLAHLAIPPAYRDVWICPSPLGHLQATGRDARGRKQYLYHPGWRSARDETKFHRMAAFGAALPRIRAAVRRHLVQTRGAAITQPVVVAVLVRLLDTTLVRVGNDEYARTNKSFGLTTLCKRHVALKGDKLRLKFRGKSGVEHEVSIEDKRVARIVRRCQSLPGQELFKYSDDSGQTHSVGSAAVNDYLGGVGGGDFTAKDFRTWHGSATALALFMRLDEKERDTITATSANLLIAEVARQLGNTVSICRKSYIHPKVLALLFKTKPRPAVSRAGPPKRKAGLCAGDSAFLAFVGAPG